MNILVIGTSDIVGGAAKVGWNIGKIAVKKGHKVNYIVGRKKTNSAHVYQLSKNSLLENLGTHLGKNFSLFAAQSRDFLLANDIHYGAEDEIINHPWYKQADLIHFHNLHGNFFKLKSLKQMSLEKVLVWTLHDMWSFTGHCAHSFDCERYKMGCGKCPYLKTYFPMLWDNSAGILREKKEVYSEIDLNIVTPSKWLMSKVKQSILRNQKTHLIYNGVNIETFRPSEKSTARLKLGLPIDKKIVLTVSIGGSKNIYKGGQYFKQLSDKLSSDKIRFISIGERVTAGTSYQCVEYVSSESDLALYYSSADVLLFPSLAENCPLSVLEAMSCRLPVVAFKVGGIPELVRHYEKGYLAKYGDVKDLEQGLEYLLGVKKSKYIKIADKCRNSVIDNFSLDLMGDRYLKLYSTLVNQK